MPSAITTALLLKDSTLKEKDFPKNCELVYNFECPDLTEDDVLINVHACALKNEHGKSLKGWKNVSGKSVGRDVSGKVTKVGKSVTRVKEGDCVVGIIPLDGKTSGCAKYCVLSQYDVVLKPATVKDADAVSVLSDAVKGYTALYYLAKIQSGDTVLLFNADSGFGMIVLQLANIIGAKVIAAVNSDQGLHLLKPFHSTIAHVIDTRSKKSLIDICMEESGGLGVDCIIDNGVDMYVNSAEDENQDNLISFDDLPNGLPSKHDIISSLAVGGSWVTSQSDLQLDPPDSQALFLKCTSLHFLFEDSWLLSRGAHGKYLHILQDIMNKLSQEALKAQSSKTVNLKDCPRALESILTENNTVIVETS